MGCISQLEATGLHDNVCGFWTAGLTMGCSTGCRGISTLAPGALPAPPSSLTWVSAELFPLHILTPLLWLQLHRVVPAS